MDFEQLRTAVLFKLWKVGSPLQESGSEIL